MKLLKPLWLLCALSMLSSCASLDQRASQTSTVATDPKAACLVFGPIVYSRLKDTVETIAAVKRHNAAFDAFCEPPS